MPRALQHEFPQWQPAAAPDATPPFDEPREVWQGAMRVVSAKRARKLRKRGVPLMPLHAVRTVDDGLDGCGVSQHRVEPTTPDGRARYAWFEREDDAERRVYRRRLHDTLERAKLAEWERTRYAKE